jgi:hypothetical protein
LSTILKALRRLEEEKAAAEEPRPLREQIASARAARSARGAAVGSRLPERSCSASGPAER